jgi:hypothetical protein
MEWKKKFKNWKLACAIALIFALCGHVVPHVEPLLPEIVPSTAFTLQVSGGQVENVSAKSVSINHPWLTKWN